MTTGFGEVKSYLDKSWVVVEIVRLPRVLEVIVCGMGLGLAGAAMQGVFRNPLVGTETSGVTPAAAFGGVLAILAGWSAWAVVASAFAFGMLALVLAFGLAALTGRRGVLPLILSGLIIGAFFGALIGLVQYFADPNTQLQRIVFWLLGSFAGATHAQVEMVAAITLAAGTTLLGLSWRINLLSLGDADARSLGIEVHALRWGALALVALIVAAQVSVSGGFWFVGLIIPHIARMFVGPEHSTLLPASSLLGGAYLLVVDDVARSATDQEIPIGLLTSFVGAPIFALLFWKQQHSGWASE